MSVFTYDLSIKYDPVFILFENYQVFYIMFAAFAGDIRTLKKLLDERGTLRVSYYYHNRRLITQISLLIIMRKFTA